MFYITLMTFIALANNSGSVLNCHVNNVAMQNKTKSTKGFVFLQRLRLDLD